MSDKTTETDLDALFAEARAEAPQPLSPTFQARLLTEARAAMPQPRRRSVWDRLQTALSDFGGAPGLAGVGVAGVAGLWIGVAGPGQTSVWFDTLWQGVSTSDTLLDTPDSGLLALVSGTIE